MSRVMLLGAVIVAAQAASADMSGWREYFVSDSAGNDAWDGTAAEWAGGTVGPKKTIQAAVDLANGKGTIVTVAPGVYDQGGKAMVSTYPCSNRVHIASVNVLLRSSGGKEVTHIVGARDTSPNNWNGLGTNAVRCVMGPGSGSVTVKGFTLRDGAGGYDWVENKAGSTRGGGARAITVVDCVISNCTAHRGSAGWSCKFVRSVITGNVNAGRTNFGDAGDASSYLNCLIVRNPGRNVASYPNLMVNCTVAGNTEASLINGINNEGPYHFANCVFVNNKSSNLNLTSGGVQQAESCVADAMAKMPNADEATITNAVNWQYRSSAGFSWQLMADAEAVGRGKGSYLRYFTLPECEEGVYRDLNGNVIDPDAASIDCGCFQGSHFPATFSGSMVVFQTDGIRVDGVGDFNADDWLITQRFPDMLRLKSATATPAYSFYNKDAASRDASFSGYYHHYPEEDGWARYVANPDRTAKNLLTMTPVAAELYVDPVNGSDANDGSAGHPLRTLQAANDAASLDYTLVHAAPGIYAEGGARTRKVASSVEQCAFSNRLSVTRRHIGFVADTPRSAVILGAPDPETGELGTNAMRCVAFAATAPSYSYLRGFDLTGGHAHDDTTDATFFYGGAVHCYDTAVQLVDCVVSNNYGCNSIVYSVTARRSKFFDNRAKNNATLRSVRAYDCVLANNDTHSYRFGFGTDAAGCTVDTVGNGIALGHGSSGKAYMDGCVLENCTSTSTSSLTDPPTACYIKGVLDETHFADFLGRDYRLSTLSPAAYLVTPAEFAAVDRWWQYFGLDAYGNEPSFNADGCFNAGASRAAPLPYAVVEAGEGTVLTGGEAGTNVLADAETVFTFDASAETRPFDGFAVNGEIRHAGKTWSVNAADLANGDVFGVHYTGTWYADASAADDSGDGFTPATAKRTLAAAAANAIAGDVIRAAPGDYAEGTMKADPAHAIENRVAVANGVTLESTGGREVTVIRGASATVDAESTGNGANAVRCVFLGSGSVLRGFTLTGGHTQYFTDKKYDPDYCGGAVHGAAASKSTVEDCVVYGCSAHTGGAGMNALFSGCVISNCTHSTGGSGGRSQISRNCSFRNCIFDHFTKSNPLELYARVDSCTFGADMKMPALYQASGENYPHVVNSVFLGSGNLYAWRVLSVFTNCVFGSKVTYSTNEEHLYVTNGCRQVTADELVFTDGYRPVVGANACVDAALEEFCDPAEKDPLGGQRRMNGVRDIGAVEADWRPRYSQDIGPGARVTEVSETVYETPAKAVRMLAAEGGAITAVLAKDKAYEIQVTVADGASLTVTKGEEVVAEFSSAADVQNLKYTPETAGEALVFKVSGAEGYADVICCRHINGAAIFFR